MRFRLLLLLPLAFFSTAAAKKQPGVTVRFHTETNAHDTSSFAIPVTLKYPPREVYIDKLPAITEREIVAIYPFPAADGTMGCAFKLDDHGTIELDTLSVEKRGTSLVAVVNGRQVTDMQIDRRVSDGIVTIPNGLAPEEIMLFQRKYKLLGSARK